ncbi:hypothetical protein LTR70_003771 [Exophiala xenobiotica]|uniref:Uncharacterized protein n=1 Tax=Lithohypha guttulata TaxID=1690604 RepID=A0ABR0KGU4_9EURO|nr:hypothetical protein LTR24_003362 [Lithohypha guttulata]KAK5322270.1 hypothetical protein LTR70_003771 [Exophiala xenobiotica]
MKQTATAAAIPGATEEYTLDWQWRSNHDALFGDIEGRSRWISVEDTRREGGQGVWIQGDSEWKLINAVGKRPNGAWEATHLWGFEVVGGDRRHTRRVKVVSKEGQELRARMVYDFEGDN